MKPLTQCPNCLKWYEPILERKANDNRSIQEQYPNALPYEREQLITGLCSDKCWNEYLGLGEEMI
jgi:hypothetical protein